MAFCFLLVTRLWPFFELCCLLAWCPLWLVLLIVLLDLFDQGLFILLAPWSAEGSFQHSLCFFPCLPLAPFIFSQNRWMMLRHTLGSGYAHFKLACNRYLLAWDYNGQARNPLQAQNMQTGSKVCMGSTKICLVSLDTSWMGKRAITIKKIKTRPVTRSICTYNVGDQVETMMEHLMYIVFIWSHILRVDHHVLIMFVALVHFLGIFKKLCFKEKKFNLNY
jgi:hypothetical protein